MGGASSRAKVLRQSPHRAEAQRTFESARFCRLRDFLHLSMDTIATEEEHCSHRGSERDGDYGEFEKGSHGKV